MRLPASLARLRGHASRVSWALSDAVVGPVLLLLLSPFLLRHLGAEGFGLWALAVAVSGIGSLASLGVGIATTKHVSADLGSAAHGAALAVTRAAVAVAGTTGALLVLLGMLASPWLAELAFARMGPRPQVATALVLGVALLVIQEIDAVFAGALRGAQRFDRAAQAELIARPVWAACVAATAWQTQDTTSTLLTSVAVNALKAVVKSALAWGALGGLCAFPAFDPAQIRRVVHFGKWVSLQGVGVVLFSVADRMLVGALLGAADLARYSICLQLTQFVHTLQGAALQPIVPWVSGTRTDAARLARLKRLSVTGGAACLVLPVAGALVAPAILALWIDPAFAEANRSLVTWLFASAAVLSFGIPAYYLLVGLGQIWVAGVQAVASGVLGLATALVFSSLGIVAFAAGRMVYAVLALWLLLRLWQLCLPVGAAGADHGPPGGPAARG